MSSRQSFFRTLILGATPPFILSHSQFKRNLLVGQLSLLTAFVCLFYVVLDLINGIFSSWPYQASCFLLCLVCFILNRNRYYKLSKLTLGATVNLVLFVFAASEPHNTGLYAIYIPICLGSMAAFGYEERWWAIVLISFSIALCCISLLFDIQVVPPLNGGANYVNINFAVNLSISALASILILYFLISVNHHSENKLLENERLLLRKNEELTKLNAELDRFVYSSSHDLRAPLSSVLGLIGLIELSKNLDEVNSFTALMRKRIDDLDKFIRKISDYSRNNRVDIQLEDVNLKKLVRDVLESLRFFPGSDQIDIQLNVDEELSLKTDAIRLKMITSNLLSNSFKYRDDKKEQSFVHISAKTTNQEVVLEIADNGIGIPEENLPRIFDMFFQAHENSVGSGLGLYIVKETIEKLGGRIEVESISGKGTKFSVLIPQA